MTAKKIFIIAAVLLVLIAGTLLVYNFFIKSQPASDNPESSSSLPPSRNETANPSGANASPMASLKFNLVSQERISGATIGSDGKTVKYFIRSNGHVVQSAFDGSNRKEISSATLNGLIKALWSPDKDKIIGIFSEAEKIKKYFYDYVSNQSALLSENIGYVAWSPDSKKIAYQYTPTGSEESTLSIANPDGTGYKNIFKTRLNNLIVDWPSKDKISIRTQTSGLAQSLVFAVDANTGNFNKILSELYGLNIKWSPKADKILYSSTDSRGRKPSLSLADATGTSNKDLNIIGLADKCVWSFDDRTIFCALPQGISENAVWPDDYYKGLLILADDFYKIDPETGAKTKIAGSTEQYGFDAQDLFLSPKEDYLFFTNRADGLLYSLKI